MIIKSKVQEEQSIRDLKQQREMWQAAEKIRRDKWITEKTKMIKVMSILLINTYQKKKKKKKKKKRIKL